MMMWKNKAIYEGFILEEAAKHSGSMFRVLCPFCKGGSSKEHSFQITKTKTGVLYYCFRASCGERGFIQTISAAPKSLPKAKKEFTPHIFKEEERELTDDEVRYFVRKYSLNPEKCRSYINYSPSTKRHVLPCFTMEGYVHAKNLRSYAGAIPKSLLYRETQYPILSYYPFSTKADTVVIVEDQISAIKLAELCPSVALLGTTMSWDKVNAIINNYNKAIIMLDPGAEGAALGILKKWGPYFSRIRGVFLREDPKDTSLDILRGELYG